MAEEIDEEVIVDEPAEAVEAEVDASVPPVAHA